LEGQSPRFPWAVFLALAIALAAVPVVLHAAWRSRMVEGTQGELQAIADLEARELAAWRAGRLEDARLALGNPLVRRAAQEALANGEEAARFGDLLAELTRGETYSEALLADAEGRIRASATRLHTPVDPATAELAEAVREGAPLLSDVCGHGPADPQHLHVVVPVPGTDGRPAGAIALRLEAETLLFSRVSEWDRGGAGSVLVRRDDDAALVLGASRGGPLAPGQRVSLDLRRAAPVRAVLGEEGTVEAEDGAGRPVLAVLRTVPGTHWHLVVHAGSDTALGALGQRAWGAAALAALLIGAAAVVVGARFRRQRAVFEAQRAELVSRIHARHVDLLVRHANDVAVLLDADLRILDANDRVLERYGWTPAELRGQHVAVLRAGGDAATTEEARLRALASEGAVWEARHRRRDGSTFPVEVSARAFEVDGRTYYQGSIRDVSDRKRAEAAVAYQAMMLERLEDAVVGTGPDGRVTFWNRAAERLYGWSAAEAAGRPADELLQPELEEAGVAPLERELLEKGSATRRARQATRDGGAVHVETTFVALREPGGALTGYVAVNRDLSRLRQVQERLAGAERLAALGALAGGIAHEVNNPLAYLSADVRSAAEALRAHLAGGCGQPGSLPDAAAALAEAEAGGQRIAAVVRDLQAFARSPGEGGGLLDLRAAVRAAAALVHNAIRHRARPSHPASALPPAHPHAAEPACHTSLNYPFPTA
jgi:PAS domain S-box-containing protein